jgi:heme-binding protein
VREGRNAVNFSEWTGYQPAQQRLLLAMSCDDARKGKMPGAYSVLRPETRLSPQDVETICAAARQADARAAGDSR